MEISITATELWRVQESLGKNNQKDIARKQRKGEQSFLCATRRPDLIHIAIKVGEDIPNGY